MLELDQTLYEIPINLYSFQGLKSIAFSDEMYV